MHLQDIQLTNILPLSVSLLQQRLSQNFKIIVQALKSQEAIRSKHDALASDNYHLKQAVTALTSRLDGLEVKVRDTIAHQVENMAHQSSAVRIEFQTMKPHIEKMKWNTDRVDAIERQFKLIHGTVKEFDVIRRDLEGMESRTQLILENYRDQANRKAARIREQATTLTDEMSNTVGELNMLKRKVESLDVSAIVGSKPKPSPELSPLQSNRLPSIDDVFKQKVLQKINNINAQLGNFAFQKQTEDLRNQLKQQKKVLDNKMDMDQYERMLNFMSGEISRAIKGQYLENGDETVVAQDPNERDEAVQAQIIQNQSNQIVSQNKSAQIQVSPGNMGEHSASINRQQGKQQQRQNNRRNVTDSSSSELQLEAFQDNKSKQESPLRKVRTMAKASNKDEVQQTKLLQGLKTRVHLLQNELSTIRQQNVDILRTIEQLKATQNPMPNSLMQRSQEMQIYQKPSPKTIITARRQGKEADGSLPAIPTKEKRLKGLDQSVDIYEGVYKRRSSKGNMLFDSKISPNQQALQPRLHELEKKLNQLRSEMHYYFKELQKSINIKQTKEDVRKRVSEVNDHVEQIKQLVGKKMDADAVKKNLLFLENKVNQVIAIMIANEGEAEATMARRGWACLSCDKNMEKFDGRQGDHKSWNMVQGRNSPPRASGFANLQRNQERYRNMYMNKYEEETQK